MPQSQTTDTHTLHHEEVTQNTDSKSFELINILAKQSILLSIAVNLLQFVVHSKPLYLNHNLFAGGDHR